MKVIAFKQRFVRSLYSIQSVSDGEQRVVYIHYLTALAYLSQLQRQRPELPTETSNTRHTMILAPDLSTQANPSQLTHQPPQPHVITDDGLE